MSCNSQIKWYDLIPIVSFLLLKGKCRGCSEKISLRYPLVELFTGLSWVGCFLYYDIEINLLAGFLSSLLVSALIVVFLMDWDTQLISTGVVIFIALLGIANTAFSSSLPPKSHIIGFFIVSVPLLLINLASKGKAMGMGDVYLMAAAGLYLGVKGIVVAIFIGLITGSIGGIILKRINGLSRFAFGPFLVIGIVISLFIGNNIADWYISLVMVK